VTASDVEHVFFVDWEPMGWYDQDVDGDRLTRHAGTRENAVEENAKQPTEIKPLREVPASESHCGRRMTKMISPGVKVIEGKTRSVMTITRACDRCGEVTSTTELM
jgi:hypothetical protein